MLVAASALVIANSPAASLYFGVLDAHIGSLSVLHWVNDGLMAVFFLLVGLEIKREFSMASSRPGHGASCRESRRPVAWRRRR